MKILLIEDDKFLRTVLERKLKNEGFEVVSAIDGDEALQKITVERPDIILLDIILPRKSGFTVLEEIKKDPEFKNIPVFIISNLAQPEDIKKGVTLGVVNYFVKANISLDELIRSLKDFVENKSYKVTVST